MLVMAGGIETVVVEFGVGKGRRRSHVVGRLTQHECIDNDVFLTY